MFIAVENISNTDDLRRFIHNNEKDINKIINKLSDKIYEDSRKIVSADLNWENGYINSKRFVLMKRDNGATIRARSRPTTLSRFNASYDRNLKRLSVEVYKGEVKGIRNAFVMNGNNGNRLVVMRGNRYLEMIDGKKHFLRGKIKDIVVLYGPSVDQVFKTHLNRRGGISEMATENLYKAITKYMESLK